MKNIIIGILIAVLIFLTYSLVTVNKEKQTAEDQFKEDIAVISKDYHKKLENIDKDVEVVIENAEIAEEEKNEAGVTIRKMQGTISKLIRKLADSESSEVVRQLQAEFSLAVTAHNVFEEQCNETIRNLKLAYDGCSKKNQLLMLQNEENVSSAIEALRDADKRVDKARREKKYAIGIAILVLVISLVAR